MSTTKTMDFLRLGKEEGMKEVEKKKEDKKEPLKEEEKKEEKIPIKEEEKKEKKEEQEPLLKVPEKKEKEVKDKETQFGELRRSRDEFKSKYEQAQEELEKFKKDPTPSEVMEYLREKEADDPVAYIKGLEEENSKLKTTREEFEKYKRDKDIRQSDEFITNYTQPFMEAEELFVESIVNRSPDGKIPNEQLFAGLKSAIYKAVEEKGKVTAPDVRIIIEQFAEAYEESTGEKYIKPPITEVVQSLRAVVNLNSAANEAYKNWEETKKEKEDDGKIRLVENEEKIKEAEKSTRLKLAREAVGDFDYDSLSGVFGISEIEQILNDVHSGNEKGMEDPAEAAPYGDVLILLSKGRMFDSMLEKYREMESRLAVIDKDSGSREKHRIPTKEKSGSEKTGSWLGEQNPLND